MEMGLEYVVKRLENVINKLQLCMGSKCGIEIFGAVIFSTEKKYKFKQYDLIRNSVNC